jgi:hypothetical protein
MHERMDFRHDRQGDRFRTSPAQRKSDRCMQPCTQLLGLLPKVI